MPVPPSAGRLLLIAPRVAIVFVFLAGGKTYSRIFGPPYYEAIVGPGQEWSHSASG